MKPQGPGQAMWRSVHDCGCTTKPDRCARDYGCTTKAWSRVHDYGCTTKVGSVVHDYGCTTKVCTTMGARLSCAGLRAAPFRLLGP